MQIKLELYIENTESYFNSKFTSGVSGVLSCLGCCYTFERRKYLCDCEKTLINVASFCKSVGLLAGLVVHSCSVRTCCAFN